MLLQNIIVRLFGYLADRKGILTVPQNSLSWQIISIDLKPESILIPLLCMYCRNSGFSAVYGENKSGKKKKGLLLSSSSLLLRALVLYPQEYRISTHC